MTSRIGNWMPLLVVLGIVTISSAGCASTIGSVCPPVVHYDQALLDRAADELDLLPADSAIERMLADYVVMRDQSRACGKE